MTDRAPLTDHDCDLRKFRDMPLDIGRFQNSGLVTHETAEAVVAAIHLWGAAWHQVPAASLPDNDKELAKMAGYGRAIDAWLLVRDGALRGFVKCSDGRLYHDVLAEKANAAWDSRLQHEWSKARDRHYKRMKTLPESERGQFLEFDDWKVARKAGVLPTEMAPRSVGTPIEGQGNLPLDSCAPAHDHAGARSRARVDDNSDGNDDTFRRNDPSIPTDLPLKGREMKGRDIYDRSSRARAHESDHNPDEGTDRSIDFNYGSKDDREIAEHLASIAGMPMTSDGMTAKAVAEVMAWRKIGVDFETVVEPIIRHTVGHSSDYTSSLHRFDRDVRHEHARTKANPRKARAGPKGPVLHYDGEPKIADDFREALCEVVGPRTYSSWFEGVTITANGSSISLNCKSAFQTDWIRQNHRDRLDAISALIGVDIKVVENRAQKDAS